MNKEEHQPKREWEEDKIKADFKKAMPYIDRLLNPNGVLENGNDFVANYFIGIIKQVEDEAVRRTVEKMKPLGVIYGEKLYVEMTGKSLEENETRLIMIRHHLKEMSDAWLDSQMIFKNSALTITKEEK